MWEVGPCVQRNTQVGRDNTTPHKVTIYVQDRFHTKRLFPPQVNQQR